MAAATPHPSSRGEPQLTRSRAAGERGAHGDRGQATIAPPVVVAVDGLQVCSDLLAEIALFLRDHALVSGVCDSGAGVSSFLMAAQWWWQWGGR